MRINDTIKLGRNGIFYQFLTYIRTKSKKKKENAKNEKIRNIHPLIDP